MGVGSCGGPAGGSLRLLQDLWGPGVGNAGLDTTRPSLASSTVRHSSARGAGEDHPPSTPPPSLAARLRPALAPGNQDSHEAMGRMGAKPQGSRVPEEEGGHGPAPWAPPLGPWPLQPAVASRALGLSLFPDLKTGSLVRSHSKALLRVFGAEPQKSQSLQGKLPSCPFSPLGLTGLPSPGPPARSPSS